MVSNIFLQRPVPNINPHCRVPTVVIDLVDLPQHQLETNEHNREFANNEKVQDFNENENSQKLSKNENRGLSEKENCREFWMKENDRIVRTECAEKELDDEEDECDCTLRQAVSSVLPFLLFAALVAILIVFYVTTFPDMQRDPTKHFIEEVNRDSIKNLFGSLFLTSEASRANHSIVSGSTDNLTQLIARSWQRQGLDVHVDTNQVLLSRGRHQTNTNSRDVVYGNYGRPQDYASLARLGVRVTGRRVLVRAGGLPVEDIEREAASQGAVGVVLYNAFANVTSGNGSYQEPVLSPGMKVLPPGMGVLSPGMGVLSPGMGVLSPGMGVLSPGMGMLSPGMGVLLEGDRAQRSVRAALKSALEWESGLPDDKREVTTTSVQYVSYDEAAQILRRLEGPVAPPSFTGGQALQYRVGGWPPGGNQTTTAAHDNPIREGVRDPTREGVRDIVGIVWGKERDRYVLIGSHQDARNNGAYEPSSATAVMLEITRVFGNMSREGWQPRRTLVFLSWSSGYDGLLSSRAFARQFATLLGVRSVAYLNLDVVMYGNEMFSVNSVATLYPALQAAAKLVASPFSDEWEDGRPYSLYDSWLSRDPSEVYVGQPFIGGLGSNGDYEAFMFQLGIPSCDFAFRPASTSHYALELNAEQMDPNMVFHEAAARFFGALALQLSEHSLLPLSLSILTEQLLRHVREIEEQHESLLRALGVSLGNLEMQVKSLLNVAKDFEKRLEDVDLKDSLAVRGHNDALLLSGQALLDTRGLPGRPDLWHQVLAPSSEDSSTMEVFPGIHDLLRKRGTMSEESLVRQLKEHIENVTLRLQHAEQVLSSRFWTTS